MMLESDAGLSAEATSGQLRPEQVGSAVWQPDCYDADLSALD